MIDPRELRLGNWYFDGKYRQVQYLSLTLDYFDWQPIPLTEDILVICGFCKMRNGAYVQEELYLHEDSTWWYSIDRYDYEMETGTKDREIKYLHQLQNLFFIINGSELIFKLET